MISQFKKLFLSLIFTVALCCGLSVSAFAADFRYGGITAPLLPAVDSSQYPYSFVYRESVYDIDYLVFSSGRALVTVPPSLSLPCVTFDSTVSLYTYALQDGAWVYSSSGSYDAFDWVCAVRDLETFWTSYDILDSSGNVSFPSQKPIPISDSADIDGLLQRAYVFSRYPYYVSSNNYLSYGGGTTSNLIPVNSGSSVTISGSVLNGNLDSIVYQLCFLTASGVQKVLSRSQISSGSDYIIYGDYHFGESCVVPEIAECIWVNLYMPDGSDLPLSDVSDIFFGTYPEYTPTITATTSNVTDTTVDLAIDVTGMDPAKTYNIRIDGTTADGEELSQVIGTITGEETYSGSATLGPFTPNTTYRATFVLVENGVDVSSDSLSFTTLPYMYSYNGYFAPASPITNEQRNPVQLMYEYDGDVYLASSGRAFILSGNNIIFRRDSLASSNVIYKLNGTTWELYNSDPAPLTALLGAADGFIWSNTDVLSNSGLYFADTTIQTHYPARYYSFNGTVLPWPNELDRSFRYDVLWKIGGSYYWMASDANYTIREAVMYTGDDSTISVLFKYNGDKWEWQETFPAGDNVCSGGFAGFIWSNHDIRNERGIYFAGSDQVEVEDPDADRDYLPVLTVNVNSVDSSSAMFDVTVYDADPDATYTIEWSVYRAGTQIDTGVGSSIMEGGTSYKGQWALSGLASGTTYSTLFELYADGETTGVMQSVSFTTNVGSSTEQPDITETPTGGYESDKDYGPLLTLMLNELYHLRYDIVPDLKSIVQTLANPAEDKVAVNNEPLLNEVNNVLYNEAGNGNALTVSDIGDLADIQGVFKGIFSGDYGFSDFLDLFSDDSFGSWFSADTAMNLNPTAYGSPSVADLDDPYNMQSYYDNMEKVRNKPND